jgi:hypothetical protein
MTADASRSDGNAGLPPATKPWSANRDAWHPEFLSQLALALQGRRFAAKYFAQLDIEYESLCPPEYRQVTAALVASFRVDNGERPNWVLNHRYEYTVMAGLPLEILRQRVAIYQERLVALVGASNEGFLRNAFPLVKGDMQVERTCALGLLSEVQRFRQLRTEFDRLRNRLLLWALILAVPLATMFGDLALHHDPSQHSDPLLGVAIAGLFGGYFSVLLRLGALRWHLDYAVNFQQVDKVFWSLAATFCLSMFEGAVAALILYSIFSAGLVKGGLFPSLSAVSGTGVDMQLHGAPNDLVPPGRLWSFGEPRLIVWSIIAGFSERLVPDFLSVLQQERAKTSSTLAKRARSSETVTQAPTADDC